MRSAWPWARFRLEGLISKRVLNRWVPSQFKRPSNGNVFSRIFRGLFPCFTETSIRRIPLFWSPTVMTKSCLSLINSGWGVNWILGFSDSKMVVKNQPKRPRMTMIETVAEIRPIFLFLAIYCIILDSWWCCPSYFTWVCNWVRNPLWIRKKGVSLFLHCLRCGGPTRKMRRLRRSPYLESAQGRRHPFIGRPRWCSIDPK